MAGAFFLVKDGSAGIWQQKRQLIGRSRLGMALATLLADGATRVVIEPNFIEEGDI